MTIKASVEAALTRNRFLTGTIAITFLSSMVIAAIATYLVLLANPVLVKALLESLQSLAGYVAIPQPYTPGFYRLIFLNNIGHFWNPIRLWVWIPLIGAFDLGYELVLNAVVIGAVASFAGMTRGPAYATAGLLPHGIIEIPAFILEFTALARWHITTTRALYAKLGGRRGDKLLFQEGVKDTLILSAFSVVLFAIAAYVETFITPHLIGR
jgi:stage II sporulation protein M